VVWIEIDNMKKLILLLIIFGLISGCSSCLAPGLGKGGDVSMSAPHDDEAGDMQEDFEELILEEESQPMRRLDEPEYTLDSPAAGNGHDDDFGDYDEEFSDEFDGVEMDYQSDVEELVERAVNNLKYGNFVFDVPLQMKVDESERAYARVYRDTLEVITGIDTVRTRVERIKVSAFMRVELKDPICNNYIDCNFYIVSHSIPEQIVPKTGYAEWTWTVTPKKSGEHSLVFKVAVRIKVPDGSEEKLSIMVPSAEKIIKVDVNTGKIFSDFFKNNWQWLWALLLTPFLALLWKFVKRRYNEK